MPILDEGAAVNVQPTKIGMKQWKKGIIIKQLQDRRYLVQMEDGGRIIRNRKHLRKGSRRPHASSPPQTAEEVATEAAQPHDA